jgi:hypothetical protein
MMKAPFQGFPPELLAQIAQAAFRPPQGGMGGAPGLSAPQQAQGGMPGLGMGMQGVGALGGGLAEMVNNPGGFGGAGGAANSPAAAHGMQVGAAPSGGGGFWSWLSRNLGSGSAPATPGGGAAP